VPRVPYVQSRWRSSTLSIRLSFVCILLVAATVRVATAGGVEGRIAARDEACHGEDGVQLEVLDWEAQALRSFCQQGSEARRTTMTILPGAGQAVPRRQFDQARSSRLICGRHRIRSRTPRRGRCARHGRVWTENPVVIGHSFAGEEMHVLGARHSARIRGLVYVDAAFDRGDDADTEAFNAVAKTVPLFPARNGRPGVFCESARVSGEIRRSRTRGLFADPVPHES
jgi:hypothetical protein